MCENEDKSLIKRVRQSLNDRRNRLIDGKINCIPSPFKRFSNDFVGIEQGKYYVVTGNTKSAKTQLSSFIFLFNSVIYAFKNPNKIKLKIFYYPLEETPEVITERFICFLLYMLTDTKIRISPLDLKSTSEGKPLDLEILKIIDTDEYQDILKFYESTVIFSNSRNPFGIYNECRNYALNNGKLHNKSKTIVNNETKETKEIEVLNYYEPNDPNEYKLIIIDHIGLITTEKGMDLRQSINKLSSEYLVQLRNKYKFTPVVIQQQTADTESSDNFKIGKLKPSLNGAADSKYTMRDCNIALGIFSPFRHELPSYLGYDITYYRGNIRFMEVMINREGESNGVVALLFDGAVNLFAELPLPNSKEDFTPYKKVIERAKNNIIINK